MYEMCETNVAYALVYILLSALTLLPFNFILLEVSLITNLSHSTKVNIANTFPCPPLTFL